MSLFEPVEINGMLLRNRFMRSATYDGCADEEGKVTQKKIDLFVELAKGGVGLIISGVDYVCPSGRFTSSQTSVSDDDVIPNLKKLTDEVHRYGAKVALQLFHAGREAYYLRARGEIPLAPSFLEKDPYHKGEHREMTAGEIEEITDAFGQAARRARESGFDAVQIHGAHAYLLSQFLSPYANRRGDQWGGSLENRLRIHRDIYRKIREKVGEDYPVLIKLGVQDGFKEGLRFEEGFKAACMLAETGYDCLEVSQGLRGPGRKGVEFRVKVDTLDKEAYYSEWARKIKESVTVPVAMVGGLRTFELMEGMVERGDADLVSLSRPLIREPHLVRDWQTGDRHRSRCISCNGCLDYVYKGLQVRCAQNEKDKSRKKGQPAAT